MGKERSKDDENDKRKGSSQCENKLTLCTLQFLNTYVFIIPLH